MKKFIFGGFLFIGGIIGVIGMYLCMAIENIADLHYAVYDFPDVMFTTCFFAILLIVGIIILAKEAFDDK